MPVINIAVPAKGDLEFDFSTSIITADTNIDALTAQELANALRDAEDELIATQYDKIADMSGKNTLEAGILTGIVIELLGWLITSAKTSGSFILQSGTIIETNAGTNCFASNPLVNQINLAQVGSTIVEGALTSDESTTLLDSDAKHTEILKKIGEVPFI